jgi:hypothetical protein
MGVVGEPSWTMWMKTKRKGVKDPKDSTEQKYHAHTDMYMKEE